MAKQSPAQTSTVERVMHAFKHGELDKPDGKPATDPRQAIAIALHEAGASNQESPRANRANLRRTRREDQRGGTARTGAEEAGGKTTPEPGRTRDDLYAEARRRDVPGRSKMTKAQLQHALRA